MLISLSSLNYEIHTLLIGNKNGNYFLFLFSTLIKQPKLHSYWWMRNLFPSTIWMFQTWSSFGMVLFESCTKVKYNTKGRKPFRVESPFLINQPHWVLWAKVQAWMQSQGRERLNVGYLTTQSLPSELH